MEFNSRSRAHLNGRRLGSLTLFICAMAYRLEAQEKLSLQVIAQPPVRILFDSVFAAHPVVHVQHQNGAPVPNVNVWARLCASKGGTIDPQGRVHRPDGGPFAFAATSCAASAAAAGAALIGTVVVTTNASGDAEFSALRFNGSPGAYAIVFSLQSLTADPVQSGLMLYDPIRTYDQSYVVVSAIKTIAGDVPPSEFFDIRFRFRLSDNWHALAAGDLQLSNRADTSKLASSSKQLTEGAVYINRNIHWVTDVASSVPTRLLYMGAGMKVFNTIPYIDVLHWGGVELAGSPFHGSSFTAGAFYRFFNSDAAVVNGDTLSLARWNIGVDFFLRSDQLDFFKVLTIRGTILIPCVAHGQLSSRIAVAVPVGKISSF